MDRKITRSPAVGFAIAGLAGLVAVPVVALLVHSGFDGLYGQDPYAYYDFAVGPLRQALQRLEPIPHFFWPPGFPLLVALLSFILGPVELAGQMVSLAAGALVPVLTYAYARQIWPREASTAGPLLAGVICALTGQLWQSSAVIMADTSGLAAATLAALALTRYARGPRKGTAWLMLAAAGFAFAILTRWAFALPAIPAAIYAVTILVRMPRAPAVKQAVLSGLVVFLVLAPLIPPLLASAGWGPAEASSFTGDLEVYRWNIGTAFTTDHDTSDGRLSYAQPNGLFYALLPLHWYYLTPLIGLFIIPGTLEALRNLRREGMALLLAWPLIMVGFHAGAPWQNFRFALAFLPPLAVLAALGYSRVQGWIPQARRGWLSIFLAAGLTLMAVGAWRLTVQHVERDSLDRETAAWVEARLPQAAQLITFGVTQTIRHNTMIEIHEIFTLTQDQLVQLSQERQPTFLLINIQSVAQQWRGMVPDLHFRWLEAEAGLYYLDEHNGYSLYLVGPPG